MPVVVRRCPDGPRHAGHRGLQRRRLRARDRDRAKSLADFIGSISFERERFEAELVRLSTFKRAAIVVEDHLEAIVGWEYRSRMIRGPLSD